MAEVALMSEQDFADRGDRGEWDHTEVVDLTSKMNAGGLLSWEAPPGRWEVLRIGHTSKGKMNHPAPEPGLGLESDKLSQEATEVHFEAMMGELIADAGPLAGKVLTCTHVDSWEVHGQNWTAGFREAFRKLRGYDPLKYLPAELGTTVDSPEITERFRWDFSMTVNDLLLENYASHLRRLANKNGLKFSVEAFDTNPSIDQAYAARTDMPMGEFWTHGGGMEWSKEMASTSHLYGKPITAAEAFTSLPREANWKNHPYSLKVLGDAAFCEGINRMVFHCFTHQPLLDRAPGMTMGPFGLHNDRMQTWWEDSKAWNDYLARCQYLLQKGLFVADVFYLDVEVSPRRAAYGKELQPAMPPGYDYDIGPAEVLSRMTVKDGRIVLPDGMSYRMLVLPPTEKMTPETLGRVRDLARAGAVIVAPSRPSQSPSLKDYPACDRKVERIARELLGDEGIPAGSKIVEREFGAGRVFLTKNLATALETLKVKPDVEFAGVTPRGPIRWIHRKVDDAEIYFIANQKKREVRFEGVFRVGDLRPELWQPETGLIRTLPDYRNDANRVRLPLRLGPAESVFIVFRESAGRRSDEGRNWMEFTPLLDISGPWSVTFDEQKGGPTHTVAFNNPYTFEELKDWTVHPEAGIKYFSGTATYRNAFNLPKQSFSNRKG
ncbi:MAG TPA: glycosyl hydrolase, partial [Oceanipulchritudo sp.]|nr:glycosyl hydrolase [Oceanipulchritudo sp.]